MNRYMIDKTMTQNMRMTMWKHTLLLLMMVMSTIETWGQDYSGTYYIGSVGYNEANTTTNYYLCPTEGWCYYQATDDFTGTDNGMPFLTTSQCRNGSYEATKAVWTIEKDLNSNYYYIKQALTGRYLTSNGTIRTTNNADRMRVHLEAVAEENLDDKELFTIEFSSGKYFISPKGVVGGAADRNWLVVNGGNNNSLQGASGKTGGPTGYTNTTGIIGVYTKTDTNAPFYLESASVAKPTITNNGDGTFTITAEPGATIYYTTDGTRPTTSTTTTGTTSVIVSQTGSMTVIKAIAKGPSDTFPSATTTYTLPTCGKPVITVSGDIVTITCTTDGATIHYTTDDTPATPSSTAYTASFSKGDATKIRAIATKLGYSNSIEAVFVPLIEVSSSSEITNMFGNYMLASNFSLTTSIGSESEPFCGIIDGNMITQSGFDKPLVAYSNGATIKNVILKDVHISSGLASVGAIACVAKGYTCIYNCGILPTDATFPEGTHSSVSTTGSYAGSIVGSLEEDSRVVNCFSYADVTCSSGMAAGIVGNNTIASNASVTDGKYANLRTMVVNCIYYGNITASAIYPVYGGQKISNKGTDAINNYNFYSDGCTFSQALTDYNCSWPAQIEYLTRYEFHRNLLNSNRELCGWWVGAPSAPSMMSTTEVQAVPKDASLMAKWVLDPAVAPYPILKPFGKYASPVNIDADASWRESANEWEGKKLGTLNVTVKSGSSASDKTLTLPITDMDTLRADYCYRKVQLPYYNTVFGNPNGTTWAEKYGGNYGDNVVIGWKVSTTEGTVGELYEDWQEGYDFADRNCTAKDANRVFAQGGYYYVPEGVENITITAQWAQAVYFDNTDHSYDRVYMSGSQPGTHFAPAGYRPSTLENGKTVLTSNLRELATTAAYTGSVFSHAVVLVGNHQYRHSNGSSGENIGNTNSTQGFTVISSDFDFDEEPDHCLIWQLGQKYGRQSFCPIRFDFLPIEEMGLAMKEDGSTQYYSLGCYRPLGHFEVTETSLIHFGQFEYSNKDRKTYAPLILNGGIFDQYTKGTNNNAFSSADDKINYIIIGGNVRIPSFTPGAHVNGNSSFPTRHCAVNVIGGSIDYLYLTGNYNENVKPNIDNPHCYIDGGRIKQVAAAGKEGIYGDVYFKINHAKIWEFYGGSTMDLSAGENYKIVKGNIYVTIDNSIVNKYCGGPKFGDMVYDKDNPENGKKITTNANNTVFTVYYGGGNGGTSYVQYDKTDVTTTVGSGYNWNGTGTNQGHLNNYTPGAYRSGDYKADYDMEIVNVSTGTEKNEAVFRTYFYAAQFSATNTGSITNNLKDCTVLTNFYGGGNLGGVTGDVTSTLDGTTHVYGSVFGAGFSASVPNVMIHNKDKTAPTVNVYTGIIRPQSGGTSTTYTWTNETSLGGKTLSTSKPTVTVDGKNYFYTEIPLENLGAVSGAVTLTIKGNTIVEGQVFKEDGTVDPEEIGGVYGGGDASAVKNTTTPANASTTVNLQGNAQVYGNVFGGGNNGEVSGSTVVNIEDGDD